MTSASRLERFQTLAQTFNELMNSVNTEKYNSSTTFQKIIEKFFSVAWNEGIKHLDEELSDEEFEQLVDLCKALMINYQDELARMVVRQLYFSDQLEDIIGLVADVLQLRRLTLPKSEQSSNSQVLQIKHYLDFLGVGDFSEKDIVTAIGLEDYEYSLLETLRGKPEYSAEILEGVSYETATTELRKWGNAKLTTKVTQHYAAQLTQHLTKNLRKKSRKVSTEEFMDIYSQTRDELAIPDIPAQFQSIIIPQTEYIDPHVVGMEELEKVPKELIPEFAQKTAFVSRTKMFPIDILFLGGPGIGTSAILIRSQTATLLMDFGMSAANNSCAFWNYYPTLNFVDAVLVSHAHLDHIGALPLLYARGFQGPWFSSKLTAEIGQMMVNNNRMLISEIPSQERVHKHEVMRHLAKKTDIGKFFSYYHAFPKKTSGPIEIFPGVEVQWFDVAHIAGSLGFSVKIADKTIVYTGDFKLEGSPLFAPPSIPEADVTIFDGTYYGAEPFDVQTAEKTLLNAVQQHEKVIIPAFSVGRAQDVIAILEKHGVTKQRKVYLPGLAGEVAKKSGVNGTYIVGKYEPNTFNKGDIVITGGGMVQGGIARTLVEQTKDDTNTAVVLCGYLAPGTLGYCLREKNPVVANHYKQKIYVSRLSGHSDPQKLKDWLDNRTGTKIMVHTPTVKSDRADVIIPDIGYQLRIE